MLKGVHFLLTYTCNFECDHCFLFCGPDADGSFTMHQIRQILSDAGTMDGMEWIYFEGGEPFLYYPIMVEGLRLAAEKGFKTGVVTNAWWATTVDDAKVWLAPLAEHGVLDLAVSDDAFHYGDKTQTPAKNAVAAAKELGIPTGAICIEPPTVMNKENATGEKGKPVVGGGAKFKGRAVETLTKGLPRIGCDRCISCPHEELISPKRIHIDPYGNVHLCQGLIIGNTHHAPISEIMTTYSPDSHPICGPLVAGGPFHLAGMYKVKLEDDGYVDECHMCYEVRKALLDRFPRYLGPKQVYGLKDGD